VQNNNSFVMFKKDMSEQPQTCSKVAFKLSFMFYYYEEKKSYFFKTHF